MSFRIDWRVNELCSMLEGGRHIVLILGWHGARVACWLAPCAVCPVPPCRSRERKVERITSLQDEVDALRRWGMYGVGW